ncbi:MAG: hypothetical protein OXF48_10350, partial [Bacteroidetes bacterium]|nr:hypothetical protein [Bacteroidota bacterium]
MMIGLAQTPWGIGMFTRFVLHASNIDLRFDSLHGFWMHSLEVRGIEGNIGEELFIRVDTVQIQLSAKHLFTGHLHAWRVNLINPDVHIGRSSPRRNTDMEKEHNGSIKLPGIDLIQVWGGRLYVADEMVEAEGIEIQGNLSQDAIALDTLYGNFIWRQEAFRLLTSGRIELNTGFVQIDTLSLSGPESNIHVHGTVGAQTNLNIDATPLSADLLGSWLPGIEERFTVSAKLQGEKDSLRVGFDGVSDSGGSLEIRGSTRIGAPFVYLDILKFEDFDVALISSELAGRVTGSMYGQVLGQSWDSLDGSVMIDLKASMLADIPIKSASLTGTLEKGIMQVQVNSDLAMGSMDLAGAVYPATSSGHLQGRFRNLNTKVLAMQHASILDGDFSMEWGDSLEGYVELLPGRLGNMEIDGGELQIHSKEDAFRLVAAVRSDTALIALKAERHESGVTGILEMNALDVGALMNQEDVRSRVSLTAESTANWPPDSILFIVEMEPSLWQQVPIQQGRLELLLQGFNL